MEIKKTYKRILLKISGETLMGSQGFGIDQNACDDIAFALKSIVNDGYELALVVGGGNIFRGVKLSAAGMEQTPADHIGMLATMMNAIALQQALHSLNCPAKVMSAVDCPTIADPYNWHRAHQLIGEGQVLIFSGGTGNPYFTTDTAAALRANEIQADIVLKATKVSGIYDKDPFSHSDAKKFDTISYNEVLALNLELMDATATALCMRHAIPIFVFNMERLKEHTITEILTDKKHGTLVS